MGWVKQYQVVRRCRKSYPHKCTQSVWRSACVCAVFSLKYPVHTDEMVTGQEGEQVRVWSAEFTKAQISRGYLGPKAKTAQSSLTCSPHIVNPTICLSKWVKTNPEHDLILLFDPGLVWLGCFEQQNMVSGQQQKKTIFYKSSYLVWPVVSVFRALLQLGWVTMRRIFTSRETMVSFIRFMYFKVTEVKKCEQLEQDQRD